MTHRGIARLAALIAAGVLLFTACAPENITTLPDASPTSVPSPTADLYVPGRAAEVIEGLRREAQGKPIVRVTITRTQARLTYATQSMPKTLIWTADEVTTSDDGTDLVSATSFDPRNFDLSDVKAMFDQAAEVAGSDAGQELQINEYNRGIITMTVTTNPESTTVFFNADATMVPRLDLTNPDDIKTGFTEAIAGRTLVLGMGIADDAIWVDVLARPGVIERRTRQPEIPAYASQRRETSDNVRFDPHLVDPTVIAALDADTVTIRQPVAAKAPRIEATRDGATSLRALDGSPA